MCSSRRASKFTRAKWQRRSVLSVTDCSNTGEVKELLLYAQLQSVKLNRSCWIGLTQELVCFYEAVVVDPYSPQNSTFLGLQSEIEDCKKKNILLPTLLRGNLLHCEMAYSNGKGVQRVFPDNLSVIIHSETFRQYLNTGSTILTAVKSIRVN